MRHYESVFILNPALSEDQVKDAIKKYEKFLNENGCRRDDIYLPDKFILDYVDIETKSRFLSRNN